MMYLPDLPHLDQIPKTNCSKKSRPRAYCLALESVGILESGQKLTEFWLPCFVSDMRRRYSLYEETSVLKNPVRT